jgi:hypothetical protein
LDTPTFDRDGYPTEETLAAIEQWPSNDYTNLFLFVQKAWSDYGWFELDYTSVETIDHDQKRWCCATGGWSGNEDIIGALACNNLFWALHWRASLRGGYYEFST